MIHLHLRPIPSSGVNFRDENLYEDWLQTLTDKQFEDHVAGRYPGPYIGAPKPILPRVLRWFRSMA